MVKEIKKEMDKQGYKTKIVCSCGIARLAPSTDFKLRNVLPACKLVERCLARNNIVEDKKDCDALIWDEVSMSSTRLFNLETSSIK